MSIEQIGRSSALWISGVMAMASVVLAAENVERPQIFMENEHWRITLEPGWGGRASRLYSVMFDYDFVSTWGEVRARRTGEAWRYGGVFRGMMSGAYNSSQPEESYEILQQTATAVDLRYENRHPMLDGLVEDRRIELVGRDVVLAIRVTNRGQEERVIYYRFHDMTGVGERRGMDSVYIVPRASGRPTAFKADPGEEINRHFLNPTGNWYALADLVGMRGLLVRGNTEIANAYFWGSGGKPFNPLMRTSEIFFPQAKLAPGQAWETEIRFTAFSPAAPDIGHGDIDQFLSTDRIMRSLAAVEGRTLRTDPPFQAEMSIPGGPAVLAIAPAHGASPRLGGSVPPDYGKSLNRIHLSGTPGEVAAFAFTVSAGDSAAQGAVSFSDLLLDQQLISKDAFEPYYVAGETQLLVKDWNLAKNIPLETISHTNNDVVDAPSITPFSLGAFETAWIWSRLRIPEAAVPGEYSATCTVKNAGGEAYRFEIVLRVRSFRLIAADHKTYGTFFDYHLQPPDDGKMWEASRNAPYALNREQYFEAMKVFRDIGVNGLVIYVARREDLLWVLDRCVELGMKGNHVLIVPYGVRPEDLAERGITAYGWTIDEPGGYAQIPAAVDRYERVRRHGLTPTFTPNVPVGLLLADLLQDMIPIINTNGNFPYLAAATKRYKEQGRKVFWYECDGLGSLDRPAERRALRGIYLWKEPMDGILDWDSSSNRPNLSVHHLTGFAGSKVLLRLGFENIRQGLIDLHYLHTLETLAGRNRDPVRRAAAEKLMNWIKMRFDSNYIDALMSIQDPKYLDDIRQRVADMIENLHEAAKEDI